MNTQNIKDRRDRKIGGVSTIKDDIELIMTDIPALIARVEELEKDKKNLRDGIQDVIDLIRAYEAVPKWKIENWLERTLKGE